MLPDDLLLPDAWPAPGPDHVELVETHVSWVFLGEREVLKVKKPVDLGFLDFRSPERRRAACEAEVRLNARLAPGVYLGLVPLRRAGGGRVAASGEGAPVDWAVRMKRLDDAHRADLMLAAGALDGPRVDRVAAVVAELHAGARATARDAARWASHSAVARNVHENFAQTRHLVARFVDPAVAEQAEERQLELLAHSAGLFGARIAAGHVRDGHGDLRLEHVYFEEDGLRIIDCIEFDPRYRIADGCADVAFLAMDLSAHGRVDLAERLLARYARAIDDYGLYELVDFYASYRAWVRGKVAALLALDPGVGDAGRAHAAAEARRHFLLAAASMRPALVAPTLVCVGGWIASGKSATSETIAGELSCPIVDADRTRKHMFGVSETQPLLEPAWNGAYRPAVTDRVYAEVLRRASCVLASGRPVVIDASFRSREL
ncbi:MAG: AAA family ATPase, partial [Polyangiaceae bacterium]